MLKHLLMVLAAIAPILGAPSLVSVVVPTGQGSAVASETPLPSDEPGKNMPPGCIDRSCCALSALLPLPAALPATVLHLGSPSLRPATMLSGIVLEPELSPPILSL